MVLAAFLRRTGRAFIDSPAVPFSSRLRLRLFLNQSRRDAVFTRRGAGILSLPTWDPKALDGRVDTSRPLFILAGGASVNELSEQHFNVIQAGVSAGINFWPIHNFVPNFLTSESSATQNANTFLNERLRRTQMLDNPPVILSLRPQFPHVVEQLQDFPPELNQRRYVYGRANLITRNERLLEGDIRRVLKVLTLEQGGNYPHSVLPDNGSSVVRLSFWAARMGFSEIVWVGVDQSSGPYFWTDPDRAETYRIAAEMVPRESGSAHSTSSSENRPFSNDVFLRALQRAFRAEAGIEIFVSSRTSTLSDEIPVYGWPGSTPPEPVAKLP